MIVLKSIYIVYLLVKAYIYISTISCSRFTVWN